MRTNEEIIKAIDKTIADQTIVLKRLQKVLLEIKEDEKANIIN
jgi:hypothetical protein